MEIKTHKKINNKLSGYPVEIKDGESAKVELITTEDMVADEKGLIHGGFIFSATDYCAMLTVNHPNVVLAKAEVKFLKPTKVGEKLLFQSEVLEKDKNKYKIQVKGFNENNEETFWGNFYCVITDKHVLENE